MDPEQPSGEMNRLLIVDDEPANIQIMSGILADDYILIAATSGRKALELAGAQSPDLILLDMMMPEMDGLQVCKALKENPATQDIPVIFVTAMSDVENEERGLQAGAVDYISKPVSPPIVRARVKIHIQNFLTVRFLEGLLSSRDMSMEEAKSQAESLLVFV
jgi:putative two-component system response regulator